MVSGPISFREGRSLSPPVYMTLIPYRPTGVDLRELQGRGSVNSEQLTADGRHENGRLPVRGAPLAGLVLLWCLARLAVLAATGWAALVLDVAFPAGVTAGSRYPAPHMPRVNA